MTVSVFRRASDGLWCVQRTINGKRKRTYFPATPEGEQRARNLAAEEAENSVSPDTITLGQLAIMYQREHPVHPDTARKIVYILTGKEKKGRHEEGPGEFLRDKAAESLTRMDLNTFRANCKKRGTGNATTNKYQAYIRAILQWGVEEEVITLNPWANFKKLKYTSRVPNATFAEFQRILAVAPDWLRWALATCYALSLRPGQVELFHLPWSAFNWPRKTVTLIQGKSKRLKTVVMPDYYIPEAWQRFQEDMKAGIPWVIHWEGKRVVTYNAGWTKALRDAGLGHRDIRMYDIRSVVASEMLGNGADLAAVSAQLGHASVTTTAIYTRATPQAQQRAANVIPPLHLPKDN